MRIYRSFTEAFPEIGRDLREMGLKIHPKTWQDKNVEDDPDFDCYELQNYSYLVESPDPMEARTFSTQPWADADFTERLAGAPVNPGEAWKLREDVWSQFLQPDGKFGYTYAERLSYKSQISKIVHRLQEDPDSRQCYLSIWRPDDIENMGGVSRIPCSLGYMFQIRHGTLRMTYLQRSADFATHFYNDVYLALRTMDLVASMVSPTLTCSHFMHWVASLHVFEKDVKGVF